MITFAASGLRPPLLDFALSLSLTVNGLSLREPTM